MASVHAKPIAQLSTRAVYPSGLRSRAAAALAPSWAAFGHRLGAVETAALDRLDRARAGALRHLGRLAVLAALRRRRPVRLTVVASLSVAVAFLLAVFATLPLLALAPLLLGVPHVASDVRYLLLRRGPAGPSPRARAPVTALLALSVAGGVLGQPALALGAAGAAVLYAGLSISCAPRARAVFVALAVAAGTLAAVQPAAATLLLAQGHNLIAIALAAWLVRGKLRAGWLPAALFGAGVAAIALGACDGWLAPAAVRHLGRAAWFDALSAVVPAGAAPAAARRWVALFAFAQSVHYGAWLRIVPDAARAGDRPASFRRSFEMLRDDLGRPGVWVVVALSLALPIAGCVSLDAARHAYVRLSAFHGFLEMAFVSCLLLARFPRRERRAR